jgi:hypothetical protein
MSGERKQAACRGCGKVLRGDAHMYGSRAYVPDTTTTRTGYDREARRCHYGGFVCSRACDVRACLELERSMPGHGITQKTVGQSAMRTIERNWDDER